MYWPYLLLCRLWAAGMREKDPEFFNRLVNQQNPEYLWIGCSDSRVPVSSCCCCPAAGTNQGLISSSGVCQLICIWSCEYPAGIKQAANAALCLPFTRQAWSAQQQHVPSQQHAALHRSTASLKPFQRCTIQVVAGS